jgi:SAM-dependent methyltransferase
LGSTGSGPDDYLRDYHRRRPGATAAALALYPIESGGQIFASSYHYLAGKLRPCRTSCKVLDLACGDGYLLGLIGERGESGPELLGVDFSDAELTAAQSRLAGAAQLVLADARHLPLRGRSMDVVVSHMALMLIDDVSSVIREVRRVLRPGGRLAAVVGRSRDGADRDAVFPLIQAAVRNSGSLAALPMGDPRTRSSEGLIALLAGAFERITICDLDCHFRLAPAAYWEGLQATYTVDVLTTEQQLDLRARVLQAIEPLVEQDGRVATNFAMRYFEASVAAAI